MPLRNTNPSNALAHSFEHPPYVALSPFERHIHAAHATRIFLAEYLSLFPGFSFFFLVASLLSVRSAESRLIVLELLLHHLFRGVGSRDYRASL